MNVGKLGEGLLLLIGWLWRRIWSVGGWEWIDRGRLRDRSGVGFYLAIPVGWGRWSIAQEFLLDSIGDFKNTDIRQLVMPELLEPQDFFLNSFQVTSAFPREENVEGFNSGLPAAH